MSRSNCLKFNFYCVQNCFCLIINLYYKKLKYQTFYSSHYSQYTYTLLLTSINFMLAKLFSKKVVRPQVGSPVGSSVQQQNDEQKNQGDLTGVTEGKNSMIANASFPIRKEVQNQLLQEYIGREMNFKRLAKHYVNRWSVKCEWSYCEYHDSDIDDAHCTCSFYEQKSHETVKKSLYVVKRCLRVKRNRNMQIPKILSLLPSLLPFPANTLDRIVQSYLSR